ncbi:23S rRNA (uracil(1939)-C(5))-methyltransferase RlmD [Colwellia sp. MEBiC06753]
MAKIFKAANIAKLQTSKMVGKTINVTIERLDINGVGVGRFEKKSVFIPHTLIGENVSAKVLESNAKFIKAKALKVAQISPERVSPECGHYYQCGGCDLQHFSQQGQLGFKQQKVTELMARQGVENLPWQPEIVSKPWHYRRKARIGVQYNKLGEAIIGFRQKESNTLIPIKHCPVLAEEFNEIFQQLNTVLIQLAAPKSIGHIEVIVTENITLVIRQLINLSAQAKQIWQVAANQYQWQVYFDYGQQLMALNLKEPATEESELAKPEPEKPKNTAPLAYLLDDFTINFSPSDFIQVNAKVNQQMVNQALHWLNLSADDVVLDLFCGLGNFSLPIARQVKQVVGVEGVNDMVARAEANAATNQITNASFYQFDLNSDWLEQVWSKQEFTKVLLDPARAGAYEACQQLLKFKARQILYVSCDPTSLAKDTKVLLNGGYQIKKIGLIDMFNQTKHVETMVLFELESDD